MRNPQLFFRKVRTAYDFLGAHSVRYLGFGVVTGISQFAVELGFAYALQGFLISIHVLNRETTALPRWFPDENSSGFYLLLAGIVLLRGILLWLHSYVVAAALEIQRHHQRSRIIDWIYRAKAVNSSLAMNLFADYTMASANLVNKLQNMTVLFFSGSLMVIYLMAESPTTTAIGILALGTLGFLLRGLDRKIQKEGISITEELNGLGSQLMSGVRNLLLIRIYGTESRELQRSRQHLNKTFNNVMVYCKFLYLKGAIPQTLGFGIICVLSSYSLRSGLLKTGQIITFYYLFLRLVQNLSEIGKEASSLNFFMPSVKKIFHWWTDQVRFGDDAFQKRIEMQRNVTPFPHPIGWSLTQVSYRYQEDLPFIFQDFSLELRAGRATIITGASGAGKSTLISLILGFAEPNSGRIELQSDGQSFRLMETKDKLIRSSGYVGAECFLIEGTIRENLFYGLWNLPSEAELARVLQMAECHFVYDFPARLDHHLTEQGEGLSAGQKQRISLARALLRQPKVLLLDEATSNLDQATEIKLVETFRRLKGQVTMVITTHRPALLALADEVVKL